MSTDFIRITEAAKLLGVTKSTLGRWHVEGKLVADMVTPGNDRRWSRARLIAMRADTDTDQVVARRTVTYARVSTAEQKDDLARQEQMLAQFCAARGWIAEPIADIGSGMNYRKRGLRTLLGLLVDDQVERLVLTHKDRLLRFGAELVFALCEERGVEVVIINKAPDGGDSRFEEDLAQDVLEIVAVFSARLYGARSAKNRKMMAEMKAAAGSGSGDVAGSDGSEGSSA